MSGCLFMLFVYEIVIFDMSEYGMLLEKITECEGKQKLVEKM